MLSFALLLLAQAIDITAPGQLQLNKVVAESVTYKGRKAIRVTEAPGIGGEANEDRLAVVKTPGGPVRTIEVELSGEPAASAGAAARGFVGIAFRVAQDLKRFECFYLRPTNGRADDQVRRNHSSQYISFPDFPWQRLRKEFPEKYESYVDIQPGEWTKVKILLDGEKARLFVHGNQQPTLVVNDLKLGASAAGSIALWIGPGTSAHFANLTLVR